MYIANDGTIWYDIIDKEGNLVKTAEQAYNDFKDKQIDICTPPTDKERIIKLEEEKSILAENVYQLAGIIEAMLGDGNNG